MEKKDLEQKNIIISSVEATTWGFKVTDEKGLKYNVSETKQDGSQTVAYKTLSELPKNGLGLNKCFKFATVPNKNGGNSRYVRIISEPEEAGESTRYVSPKMTGAKPVKIEKENTDWDKISWGKCKTLALVEDYKKNGGFVTDDNEQKAENFADRCMRDSRDIDTIPLPDEEINLDNIF